MGRVVHLVALGLVVLAVAVALPAAAHGQTQPAPLGAGNMPQQQAPPSSTEGPSDVESNVGYIDGAIPMNVLMLRFDTAYGANSPARAEYFYAKPRLLGGRGPALPEARVDFQELTTHLEVMAVPGTLSGFLDVPFRWVNPEFNDNEYGLGDLYAGFKWAFHRVPDALATFQLRGSVPTRVAPALGTNHYSIEPALLFNRRLLDVVTLEGELRYWVPLGGSDFAGDVIRYGIGVSYCDRQESPFWLAPVAEVVGWTVLNGKQTVVRTPTDFDVVSAAGDTIVNFKVGLRAGLGQLGDAYVGYGHALTGDRWYRDVLRLEFRMRF